MKDAKVYSILVVDDTQTNLDLLATILGDAYDVSTARDGHSAFEILETTKPDLILLDIMMPEMNGYEVCTILKRNKELADIPIIFLTARTAAEDIVRAFEIGAEDYISKPFNTAELMARVKAHLEIKNSRDVIKQKVAEQRELFHILCHDLANPFSSIIGVLELLQNSPEYFSEYGDLLRSAARNGMEVINLVREMHAMEEKPLLLKRVNLLNAANESLSILAQKFKAKDLKTETHIDPDIYVRTEKTSLINSVLNNILTNAVKFSFEGTAIEIRAYRNDAGVYVSIKDSGIGMPPKLLEDLFDIHKATSLPGTLGEEGTGYGMPLIERFMKAYGGDIRVTSRDISIYPNDHGTEITLRFVDATEKGPINE